MIFSLVETADDLPLSKKLPAGGGVTITGNRVSISNDRLHKICLHRRERCCGCRSPSPPHGPCTSVLLPWPILQTSLMKNCCALLFGASRVSWVDPIGSSLWKSQSGPLLLPLSSAKQHASSKIPILVMSTLYGCRIKADEQSVGVF